MKLRRLGKTGFDVSEIGLGCWQLGGDFGPVADQEASQILENAGAAGVNFWDTADVYGGGLSEERVGAALPEFPKTFVATKVGRNADLFPDGYSRDKVAKSLQASTKRLGVDQLDLAQLHCVPKTVLQDGKIFDWMDGFERDGLIKNWGASVETVEEGMLCLEHSSLATLQIIFNLFRQDAAKELLPNAKAKDVGIIVRLPLASGMLSGKYSKTHVFAKTDHRNYNKDGAVFSVGETFSGIPFEKGVELVEKLDEMRPTDMQMSQFALRWILDHDAVSTVIAGVSKPDQLQSNTNATKFPALSEQLHENLHRFYSQEVRQFVRGEI